MSDSVITRIPEFGTVYITTFGTVVEFRTGRLYATGICRSIILQPPIQHTSILYTKVMERQTDLVGPNSIHSQIQYIHLHSQRIASFGTQPAGIVLIQTSFSTSSALEDVLTAAMTTVTSLLVTP